MKTFKVRVTGRGHECSWYKDKIGQEFDVHNYSFDLFEDKDGRGIYKSDCVIVEEFKVGDRVRVKDECVGKTGRYGSPLDGGYGVIKAVHDINYSVHLDTMKPSEFWRYLPDDLILVEDKMETYNGYKQLKDITVKALILAGADDSDTEKLLSGFHLDRDTHSHSFTLIFPIPLADAIDYASSCNEKLQWLVDQGFTDVVEEELKPCPFCGGEAEWTPNKQGWIRCPNCGSASIIYDDKQEAVTRWNSRV